MENPTNTIPLHEIHIGPRMRRDYGDLSGLADSIRRNGLIQPVVIDENKNLIAGGRRCECYRLLGLDRIEFVYKAQVAEDVREELEFEENFYRKSMTWQEEALGILSIYEKKKLKGALEGFECNWQKTISEMFGMAIGTVNYILVVAKKLRAERALPEDTLKKYHSYSSINEAYRMGILMEREDALNAQLKHREELAAKEVQLAQLEVIEAQAKPLATTDELLERYNANPLNAAEETFEQYQARYVKVETEKRESILTVNLSNSLIHGDSIDFMLANPARFNHIVTDIPYGIDMKHLNQSNQHGGMSDVDRVEEAHDVEENMNLMARFFTAAFVCTDEKAFVITCCDFMQWQYMYDLAIAAGFAVQRWPYVWRKVNQSVMNNCAGYNTTKDYEIVMICRKKGATLAAKKNSSFTDAGNGEVTKMTGHPFAKPFELTRDLITLCSIEGQSILDPFAGGGSMVIQGLRMKRAVVGVEKEEHHFNSLVENVKREVYLKVNPKTRFV